MSRGPLTFRQRDVARLVRAATAAGLRVRGVRVDTHSGIIEVVTGDAAVQNSTPTQLDEWMAKHAHSAEGR
jgi:hypothetical protein